MLCATNLFNTPSTSSNVVKRLLAVLFVCVLFTLRNRRPQCIVGDGLPHTAAGVAAFIFDLLVLPFSGDVLMGTLRVGG